MVSKQVLGDNKAERKLQAERRTLRTQDKRTSLRRYYDPGEGRTLYRCRARVSPFCWVVSVNRFNCPSCLEYLEDDPDNPMDVLGWDIDEPAFS